MFYPSFAFKRSVIQQRGTVVLDFMSSEALSCKGGASILLPCMLARGSFRLLIDSHISILFFLQLKKLR